MSPLTKAAIGAGVLFVVVVLFVLLRASDSHFDSTTTSAATTQTAVVDDEKPTGDGAPTDKPADEPRPGGGESKDVPVIRVEAGAPVGGVQELEFTSGDQIEFKVVSDVADEVHFHGYDVSQEVEAGGSTTFSVPATIEGLFEVELEEAVVPIADITVSPG